MSDMNTGNNPKLPLQKKRSPNRLMVDDAQGENQNENSTIGMNGLPSNTAQGKSAPVAWSTLPCSHCPTWEPKDSGLDRNETVFL